MNKAFLICCLFGLYACLFHGVQGCGGGSSYQTSYEEKFARSCKSGQSVVQMKSAYSKSKEDRIWGHACRANSFITTSCAWSLPANQYVNDHNENVNFICPREGYMVGMYAEAHHSIYGDRRFDFKCCDAQSGLGQSDCKWTDYVNDWEGVMDYDAPSDYFIAGISSVHLNYHQDRRWKFYICK